MSSWIDPPLQIVKLRDRIQIFKIIEGEHVHETWLRFGNYSCNVLQIVSQNIYCCNTFIVFLIQSTNVWGINFPKVG